MTAAVGSVFGRAPAVVVSAPGRVNLLGEHTDYNGGAVLPTMIPQRTTVALAPRTDRRVRVTTTLGDREGAYRLGAERPEGDWLDYVAGCTRALAEAGHAPEGADLAISSTVPAGSGLASSAALTVAVLRAFVAAFSLPLDEPTLARLAHRVESDFVGARVGMMDPLAVSLAETETALFLDLHTLAFERVPLPSTMALVVIDSNVRHALASGDYNVRRAECEEAARRLGVERLCALGLADLDRVARLPAPLDRRVRHVVTEHARVAEGVRALRAGDLPRLGQLWLASHASQRDDYQCSVPEVDCLVELAWDDVDVFGARLTGGGFGGSVVALVRAGAAPAVGSRLLAAYRRVMGGTATLVVPSLTGNEGAS